MVAIQEKKLLSINELDEKTRAELVRDIACTVFFGYYDKRRGYRKLHLKYGGRNQGIYGFLHEAKYTSDNIKEYEEIYFTNYHSVEDIISDEETLHRKYNPYSSKDFKTLIDEFHDHILKMGEIYKVFVNKDFFDKLLPVIFDEISHLCNIFTPEINEDDDIYNMKDFSQKYINDVNLNYVVELLPTMPEIYRNNERGESVLYAKQTYEYNTYGDIVKITTNITDEFGGGVIVRYRDTLI